MTDSVLGYKKTREVDVEVVESLISADLSTRMKTTDGFAGDRKDIGMYTVAEQATLADAFAIITAKHIKAVDSTSAITVAKAKAEAIKRAECLAAAKSEESK